MIFHPVTIILPVTEGGIQLLDLTDRLRGLVNLAMALTIGILVALLALRLLSDLLRLNPFGRLYQGLRLPTNKTISHMRSSRFYYPLRSSFGFDPAVPMALISLAILWYVATGVLQNLFFLLGGIARSLIAIGSGSIISGGRLLIGVVLLGLIFFLMALMTIVFVNWLFGLFRHAAMRAQYRLAPLLRIFEFGGAFAGWSFVILWIALSFAASAVQVVFFSGA